MTRKGFDIQFNWIFVMIAGALILGFFFTIAQKQRALSTEHLQRTLAVEVEEIFVDALVSKGTSQSLPLPEALEFDCEKGCVCDLKIASAKEPFGDKAIFAPQRVSGQDALVWTLDWKQPYRVMNFLFVTNPSIKYYFVYQSQQGKLLVDQLVKGLPPPIKKSGKVVTQIDFGIVPKENLSVLTAEAYDQVKFVFVLFDPNVLGSLVPASFFRESQVSAINIEQDKLEFYEGKGSSLVMPNPPESYAGLPMLYAAMFAQNNVMYECGMRTAIRKLSYLSQLYLERAATLQDAVLQGDVPRTWCEYGNKANPQVSNPTIIDLLSQQHDLAKKLMSQPQLSVSELKKLDDLQARLDEKNRNDIVLKSCPEVF